MGISSIRRLTINNSSIINNYYNNGQSVGSGIFVNGGERVVATNTTFANKTNASNKTGGVAVALGGIFRIRNSIIAGNRNQNNAGAQDASGLIVSLGNNLISDTTGNSFDPNSPLLTGNISNVPANLAPLANYGGSTMTRAPLSILRRLTSETTASLNLSCGAENLAFALVADQRGTGAPRKTGASVNIGAFERNIIFDQSSITSGSLNLPYNGGAGVQLSAQRQNNFAFNPENDSPAAPTQFSVVPNAGEQMPPGLTLSAMGLTSGTLTQTGSLLLSSERADTDAMAGGQQFNIVINTTRRRR
jgi:hypothetical protein